ncbi:MAG: TonB-dependent receptor [Cellvibrionaceae bacterium]|nr:TonB-dependent receptor [Cellvibrionaceae bacterium]
MKTSKLLFRLGTVSSLCALSLPALAASAEAEADKNNEPIEEVLVHGTSLELTKGMAAIPRHVLAGDELARRRQGGLGETLAGIPGVHLDNFGAGASRPVIRGQTLPRIEILSNGSNLFDVSSVSPDHAITADPLLLDGIEVLRGPAAALYGGNALNGAINLIDSKVPRAVPDEGVSGAAEARYGSADEETSIAARLTAGSGNFAFHIEGVDSSREDYDVPSGFGSKTLKDSFADQQSFSLGGSWITDKGYIGLAYTRQESDYGLPGHSHDNADCHTHGTDLHCAMHEPFVNPILDADDSHTAQIELRNERIELRADYRDLLPGIEELRLRMSYTDYVHDEIDGAFLFSRYGNEVYDARLEFSHEPIMGFSGTVGLQYTDTTFTGLNLSSIHKGNLPQEFVADNIALFVSQRRSFGDVDIEFSARKEWRDIEPTLKPLEQFVGDIYGLSMAEVALIPDWYMQPIRENYPALFYETYPKSNHEPLSLALGGLWNINSSYALGLNLARSQRAPSMRELYAQGNNLASNSYEVGIASGPGVAAEFAPALTDVEETVRSVDLMLRGREASFEFEIGAFYQSIDNYVFTELIEQEGNHRYLRYRMADVDFYGIDGQFSLRVNDATKVTLFGDYVRADLKDMEDNLPRIAPGRLGLRVNWDGDRFSADMEYYKTFDQDRIASYETETKGYGMLNATAAYKLIEGDQPLELYLRATNLTDQLAYVHTSFVKDQSPLRGRNLVMGLRMQF